MTFVEAIVDTLLPGDDLLPPGTAAGVRIDPAAHLAALDAIARAAGSEDRFVGGDAASRATAVREVERAMPAELAELLYEVVEGYYDSDAVSSALGWTVVPPQPDGHPLPAFDEGLLAAVRRRAPMWTDPGARS